MEIDGDLEMVRIAIATGALLDDGNLGTQAFGDGVGDVMREVGQHIRFGGCSTSRCACRPHRCHSRLHPSESLAIPLELPELRLG